MKRCPVKGCERPAYFKLCSFHEVIAQKERIGMKLESHEVPEEEAIRRCKE